MFDENYSIGRVCEVPHVSSTYLKLIILVTFLLYGDKASWDLKLEQLMEHLHIQPRDYQDAGL